MRLMIMHKNDPRSEAGEKPPMELVRAMGDLVGGFAKDGRLIDGAGLARSELRTRLVFRGGRCTTKQGPYAGEHELAASLMVLKVPTREIALGWAERYGAILGDGELELGKVNEPWDIGLMPAPENPPLQMLLVDKADKDTESGRGRSTKQKTEIARLKTEMEKAGVLLRTIDLQPSAKAKRLKFDKNQLSITDGPFAETKELIGGFIVLELADVEEAIVTAKRYAAILGGTIDIDIRQIDTNQ